MMNKKISIGACIVCLIIGVFYYLNHTSNTLTIGIFVGSNWGVPEPNSYQIIDDAIARFEQEHPNTTITYISGITKDDYSSWLSSLIVQGKEPDLYMVLSEDFNTLAALGALEDLNISISNDSSFDISEYYKSSLHAGLYHNHQYALPYQSNPTVMFVNKTLLEKEGIQVPSENWTLDDFYSICHKVTKDSDLDGVIDQFGYYNYDWQNVANAYGITLFDEEGTSSRFNDENMKPVIQYIEKLNNLQEGRIVTSNDFDEGRVAFCPLTFSDFRTYQPYPYRVQKYSTFEWECIPLPKSSSHESLSETDLLLFGMSSRSSHKDLA